MADSPHNCKDIDFRKHKEGIVKIKATVKKWAPSPVAGGCLALLVLHMASPAAANPKFGDWGPNNPEPVNNGTLVAGGCPIESRDALDLYVAGGFDGTLDIWVYHRPEVGADFEPRQKIPEPVSDPDADDFCPTPVGGKYLFFVSTRDIPGACGSGDIYLVRNNPSQGWTEPQNLGCFPDGPNSAGGEFSPSFVETADGTFLYYSSTGLSGSHDIYRSRMQPDGSFGPGEAVAELNTGADDRMPNVSKDGREVSFSSNRDGGVLDVYYASRDSVDEQFGNIINLSDTVPFSTAAVNETRASMSWDGKRLRYGADGLIYVSERDKATGKP